MLAAPVRQSHVFRMRRTYPVLILLFLLTPAPGHAGALDGMWFSCEYAHSNSPPPDDCRVLDDDGFLVRGGNISYIKVQDGDPVGCRGNRRGQCFDRSRKHLAATTMGIGKVTPTSDGGIVSYLWCDQAYRLRQFRSHAEIRPIGSRCFWTSDKTYYVARWPGQIELRD